MQAGNGPTELDHKTDVQQLCGSHKEREKSESVNWMLFVSVLEHCVECGGGGQLTVTFDKNHNFCLNNLLSCSEELLLHLVNFFRY